MPQSVVELAQGNVFTRSSDSGSGVDTAQRVYKILLNSPNETLDVPTECGIDVGSSYMSSYPIPCVGWEARHEGDSRMVVIVTFRYRSTPGGANSSGGGDDPRLSQPTSRPALYSLSSSLQEFPAIAGRIYGQSGSAQWGSWSAVENSAGDHLEGLTKLEPVVTAKITQYSYTDQSASLAYVGYINSDQFSFSGHTVPVHCCMFQSLNVSPYVESGFRGFQVEFEFVFRNNVCNAISYGSTSLGWDSPIINSGYNIINSGLGTSGVAQEHLAYERAGSSQYIKEPKSLINPGVKTRAQIPGAGSEEGETQHESASPVLLNIDGTPRDRSYGPIIWRVQTQPEMTFGNNFSSFGINSFT
jgi:hypothetical protein